MNRRKFVFGTVSIALIPLLPAPPISFRGVPIIWDAPYTSDALIRESRSFWWSTTTPDIFVCGKNAYKMLNDLWSECD